MRITPDELQAHLQDHIAAVEAGDPLIVVNEAGRPIAEIRASSDVEEAVIRHDPAKKLSEFVPGPRPPRLDFDAVQWLLQDREERRY